MGLKYVVKKRVFGFDKTKTEKYVAQHFITNTMNFKQLCNEVSKLGLIPEGTVKHVLDGMIDALVINLNKGISIQLGDFGCFRPGINCKSQDTAEAVDSSTIQRVKIIFTPGYKFKVLDGLITNFHLPESTLIMLVSALAGYEHTMAAYKEAVEKKFRFYSFGDAMFIADQPDLRR